MTLSVTDNVALSGNGTHGVSLAGTVTGSLTGNAIENNAGYGIACHTAGVALTDCDNTLAGNVLGEYLEENGCSLAVCY